MRSRAFIWVLAIAMIGATTAGGIAAEGGGAGDENAAESQYDPPATCPNGERVDNNCGNGQGPGNNQGNGQTTCPNGQPFPNCGRSPREQEEAKQKALAQCRSDTKSSRAALASSKLRHRKLLAKFRGRQRRLLASQFAAEERRTNRRISSTYRQCRTRANSA